MLEESSECSEIWDGHEDSVEECSAGCRMEEETDVTLHPGEVQRPQSAAHRPPRMPAAEDRSLDHEASEQDVLQRLEERRQLLEDTLSPARKEKPAFDFSAADGQLCPSAESTGTSLLRRYIDEHMISDQMAVMANAVESMEAILLGDFGDLSDFDDSSEGEDEPDLKTSSPLSYDRKLRSPSSPSKGGA